MLETLIAQSTLINTTITQYVVAPLLIFFGGITLSVLLRNGIASLLHAVQLDLRLDNTSSISVTTVIANGAYVIGWLVSASLALMHIGLFGFTLQRILFFLFWVGLLAAGFAFTDALRNFIKRTGARKCYPVGSTYVQGSIQGVVKKHTLTHLVVFTNQVERVHVPYLTAARVSQ